MTKFQRYMLGMFFVIAGINFLGLWSVQYLSLRRLSRLEKISNNLSSDINMAISEVSKQKEEKEVPKETVVADERQAEPETKTKPVASISPSPKIYSTVKTTTIPTAIKEQTAYIGSGSSSSTSWSDINSAMIELNSVNYPNVERVVFEANLSIIGGEAFARLKNRTTGEIIESSTVMHNTSTSAQRLSSSFNLSSGSNEYIVQLRSSSGERVTLDGARLRIYYR